jgi:hypothetical protein
VTSACFSCGDGVVNPGEACDGGNLNGWSCGLLGFAGGAISCDASCQLDDGACTMCGNGVIDGDEECDGADRPTCVDLGWDIGATTCNASCHLGTANCDLSPTTGGGGGGCFQLPPLDGGNCN